MDAAVIVQNIPNSEVIQISYQRQLPANFVVLIRDVIVEKINMYNSFTIHLDLQGLNITTLMNSKGWIDHFMHHFDAVNYESFLRNVYIYNAPFIAKPLYSIISRYVRNIKERIVFVPKSKKGEKKNES